MDIRRVNLLVSATVIVASVLACRIGTPTPAASLRTATPSRVPTATSLPTITPLPSPTPPPGNTFVLQKATVTAVKFFEGGSESPPHGERDYAVQFPRSSTRYVYCEVNLDYAEPGEYVEFVIDMNWYDSHGTLYAEQAMQGYAEADWTSSAHASGRGWDRPGKWEAGRYRVELSVSGQIVASGSFTITGAGIR